MNQQWLYVYEIRNPRTLGVTNRRHHKQRSSVFCYVLCTLHGVLMLRMAESTVVFRSSSRGSKSSVGRITPTHRSHSLSTLSSRPKHDPTIEMSKIRDHDLKINIEAQVVGLHKSDLILF